MVDVQDDRSELARRLERARTERGFKTAKAAASFFGWNYNTYAHHERGLRTPKDETIKRYAKGFRVQWSWLLTGYGREGEVPLVGYVGAGAEAHFYGTADDPDETVPAPDGATPSTVAVEIRGESLGAVFDRWLVFYDDRREPVTQDLMGRLCIIGLADDRVLVKKLRPSRTNGLYHLLSNTEEPILDAAVEWAARVKIMVPR